MIVFQYTEKNNENNQMGSITININELKKIMIYLPIYKFKIKK